MSIKSIGVCFPSGDTVKTDFMISFIRLLMRSGLGGISYSMGNKQSCYVDMNRNILAQSVLDIKKDALLFLDTDMTVPANLAERLAAHDVDIVGCDYVRRHVPYDLNGRTLDGQPFDPKGGMREMESMGMGAMLIKMSVFAAMKAPWFYLDYANPSVKNNGTIPDGEDRVFCRDARAAGFTVWCDQALSMDVTHYGGMHFQIQKQEA